MSLSLTWLTRLTWWDWTRLILYILGIVFMPQLQAFVLTIIPADWVTWLQGLLGFVAANDPAIPNAKAAVKGS